MKTILFLDNYFKYNNYFLSDIFDYINTEYKVFDNSIDNSNFYINEINEQEITIGFLYNNIINDFPFFQYVDDDFSKPSNNIFFTEGFDLFIQNLKDNNPNINNIIIDLITCDINCNKIINEINNYENNYDITIRYSLDKTGNSINSNTNWILESHNVDIKSIYFNNNINSWNKSLGTTTSFFDLLDENVIKIHEGNNGGKHYILTQNISGVNLTGAILELSSNDIFDGKGYTIDLGSVQTSGIFTISTSEYVNNVKILNLNIHNGSITNNSGFIFTPPLSTDYEYHSITIKNCSSTSDKTGGLSDYPVGQDSGVWSGSNGVVGSAGGGIVGRKFIGSATNYNYIYNCYSDRDIEGNGVGGILGTQGEYIDIKNCYSTGHIKGIGNGGIVGNKFYFGNIENCYTTGDIGYGSSGARHGGRTNNDSDLKGYCSGGIAGPQVASAVGNVTIKNCYTTGDIKCCRGGGIVGQLAGENGGTLSIINCYTLGAIFSSRAAGGISGNGFLRKYAPNDGPNTGGIGYVYNCYCKGVYDNTIGNTTKNYNGTAWYRNQYFFGQPVIPTAATLTFISTTGETDYSLCQGVGGNDGGIYNISGTGDQGSLDYVLIKADTNDDPIYSNEASYNDASSPYNNGTIWDISGTLTKDSTPYLYVFTRYPWNNYSDYIDSPTFNLSTSSNLKSNGYNVRNIHESFSIQSLVEGGYTNSELTDTSTGLDYFVENASELNLSEGSVKKLITKNNSVNSFSLTSATSDGNTLTLMLFNINALDSSSNSITFENKSDEYGIFIEIENDNLDSNSNYLLYKYESGTILEDQPDDYPVALTYDSNRNTYYGTLTGLSEIGLSEEGNTPCPCFHENTEILCYDPKNNEEFYKKSKDIIPKQDYLKIHGDNEKYKLVSYNQISYYKNDKLNNKYNFFYNKNNNNIILTGGHNIVNNDGSEINCIDSCDFELLNNSNKINKIFMISVFSDDNNKSYNIYLRDNIISQTTKESIIKK